MNEELKPLPLDIAALLADAKRPLPPAGFENRVFERIASTLAESGGVPTPPAGEGPVSVAPMGSWGIPVSIATLVLGLTVGVVVGRETVSVPIPPPPPVVSVPVVEPSPAPMAPPTLPPSAVASPKPARKTLTYSRDLILADERALIEIARSALSRGNLSQSLDALKAHADLFPKGQFAEERETLHISALARDGKLEEARARAQAFQKRYPNSLLLEAVQAATGNQQ